MFRVLGRLGVGVSSLCVDGCERRVAPLGGTVGWPTRPQVHWKEGLRDTCLASETQEPSLISKSLLIF